MVPGVLNIDIYKGSRFEANIEWKDENGVLVPITNFVWKMQIRETWDSASVIFELNEVDGTIVATDPGIIALNIPADDTEAMDFWTAVYDLEFQPPAGAAFRDKLIRGGAKFHKESTL